MTKIRHGIREYLALRRSLGFKLDYHEYVLNDFASFYEKRGLSHITTREALKWAKQRVHAQPRERARRLTVVRGFTQYWITADPRTEIPPRGLLSYRYTRKAPYIYTDEQVSQLIEAAKGLTSRTGLRSWTYSTLYGLVAAAGLRVRETVDLDDVDVDLKRGVLTIRRTKFGKTRIVPIHPSTQRELQRYVRYRKKVYPTPRTPAFFVAERGTRLTHWAVRSTFHKVEREIGLRGKPGSSGPRLHDLRHTMAVRTLIDWYRAGLNIEQQMPKLSTYLGHTHVTHTYWYLSAVPELLCLASARLERSKGGSS